jgi:hypothetical protein
MGFNHQGFMIIFKPFQKMQLFKFKHFDHVECCALHVFSWQIIV